MPVAGYSGDDQKGEDGNPCKPFSGILQSPHEIVPEEIGPGLPGERPECRPGPVCRLGPHRIEDLVREDAGNQGKEKDARPGVPGVNKYPDEEDQPDDQQGMAEDPAGPEDLREEEEPYGFIDQVREDASERTGRDETGVADEVREEDPEEDAGQQVGEEVH